MRLRHPLCTLLALACAPALASQEIETRVADGVDRVLADAYASQPGGAAAFTVHRPEQLGYELGAVLDVRASGADGIPVLAVTPGSAAARIGLRAGDRVLAINGRSGDGAEGPGALLEAVGAEDGAVRIELARGAERLSLAGQADILRIPAYTLEVLPPLAEAASGCGFVSGGAQAYGQVRKVRILSVDGEPAPARLAGRLRLAAGRHHLRVAMLESLGFLPRGENRPSGALAADRTQNREALRSGRGMPADTPGATAPAQGGELVLVLEVAADRSYQLGARPDGQGGIEAFVWRESERRCRD